MFCLSHSDFLNHGISFCTFGTVAKPLMCRGALCWFQNVTTWRSYLILNKKSLKSKLKIREEFGHTFGIGGKHD